MNQHFLHSGKIVESRLFTRHLLMTELDDVQRLFRHFVLRMLAYHRIVGLLHLLLLLLQHQFLLALLALARTFQLSLTLLLAPITSDLGNNNIYK